MKKLKFVLIALCIAAMAGMGTVAFASAETSGSVTPHLIDLSSESFFENAVASFVPSGGKGAIEEATAHWKKDGDAITRVKNVETSDVEGNYAALYFNDCYLRYFELNAQIKYGQKGLTGVIFGKKDMTLRHMADGNALYFLPDPCVELKGSTITAKKTSAKFSAKNESQDGGYYSLKLVVCADYVKCYVDGNLKIEAEYPEELFGYGRIGLFTANAAGSFRGNVEIYNLDARGNRIAFENSTLVKQITATKDSFELEAGGESEKFAYSVLPQNATNKNVRFLSDNPDIATCDTLGNIHALKAGTTEIYAITEDGGFRAAARVTVIETKPALSGITISQTQGEVAVGEKLYLSAGITPEDAENLGFRWSCSNSKVAMVNNGTVTALGEGECTVTVRDYNGDFSAECKIKVTPAKKTEANNGNENEGKSGCGSAAGAVAPVAGIFVLLASATIAAIRRKKENV